MINNSAQKSFNGLYIHLPFCFRKCFYCSFAVVVGHENKIDAYLDCLEAEMGARTGGEIASVYFGGGTPTILTAAQLDRLSGMVRRTFRISDDCEWTVEGNPEGLSEDKIRALKGCGVNRFSLGVQSLDDRWLKYLGRNHDSRTAVDALQRLRDQGFTNVSADLMFGFPDQTIEELREDVRHIVSLNTEHLSLYALTIEKETRFHTRNVKLPRDTFQAESYAVVMEELERAGFVQYEISNFARPGFESRHNINYWLSGNYIGVGVGAHSHRDGRRWWNSSNLFAYMKKVIETGAAMEGEERLTSHQRLAEALVFGLRMNQGVDVDKLQLKYGVVLEDGRQRKLSMFINEGLLYREGNFIRATGRGRMVLEEMAVDLV